MLLVFAILFALLCYRELFSCSLSLSLAAFKPFSLSECEWFFHSMFWALGDPFNLEAPAIQFC